jgi:tetratricopeptide (TPR) repeat protein
VGGSRTALPRQQTLRALIDWSYDLLSEEEKNLLRIASVFVGGWTLDALEAVSEDPDAIEHLEGLVNKSLVVTEERNGEMRYFLLETIRQYAREKLFESKQAAATRDRHFVYFDELSEEMWDAFRELKGFLILRDQAYDEFENMRAAVEWGLDEHPERVMHLVANFAIVSNWMGSMIEGLVWLKRAIEQFRNLPPVEGQAHAIRQALLSKALFAQGMVGMATGGVKLSLKSLDEAITIARLTGDKRLQGYALEMYYTATAFEDMLDAAEYAEEGFAIFSEIDDSWGMSMALMNMARIALARGDRETSQKYFGLLRSRMNKTPVSFMNGMMYLGTGSIERGQGHLDSAKQHFEEGLKIFKQLRHAGFENVMRAELGHIARIQGNTSEAVKIYRETILHFQDMGNRPAVAHQLECFGFLAIRAEEPQRAAKLFGAANGLRERIDSRMTEYERSEFDQYMTQLLSMLAKTEFNTLWMEGRSMSMEQAIQLALDKPG